MTRETKRRISKTASSQTNAKRTRIIGLASYESLLAEDVITAKRKRDEDDECSIEPGIILWLKVFGFKVFGFKVFGSSPRLKVV